MYESVVHSGDMDISSQYPVMVEGRYLMDTTPCPRYDAPSLHMSETLYLYGAGREKRIYAIPPYTRVEPLEFEDFPFRTEHKPEQSCEKCGNSNTYLTRHYIEGKHGGEGRWAFFCSDTSYCQKQILIKTGKKAEKVSGE